MLSHFGRPKGRWFRRCRLQQVPTPWPKPSAARSHSCHRLARHRGCRAAMTGVTAAPCLMENTRFHPGEETNDPRFVRMLAGLGDLFVNDAFSAAHRAHASTEGVAHLLPAVAGRAMEAELDALEQALEARNDRSPRWSEAPRSQPSSSFWAPVRKGRQSDCRRRHGQHLPCRTGQAGRQIACASMTCWKPLAT